MLAHPPSLNADTLNIAVLIGADHYWDIVGNHIVRGDGPTAVASKLGYLLSGPNPMKSASAFNVNVMRVGVTPEEQFQKFWDIESIGITDNPHAEKLTYKEYTETHLRMEDNRYIAKLPWREDHPPLSTNYNLCTARTRSMVKRLTPKLRTVYDRIIQEQTDRGFIEEIREDDPTTGHYLPHHPVKKDSETTPIRIVYDCSCKTAAGTSINDCLEAGPPLLNDLAHILLRFRTHQYGLSADLEKAFLHIGLDEQDQQFTKFLWLSDPNDPESTFSVYKFKVVLFGAVCSPFILNATVKKHLEQNASPISDDIGKNTYVDNIISGCDNVSDLKDYYHESNTSMQHAGFNLREWATNSADLHEIAKSENRACTDENVNVLGINWNLNTDTLSYPNKRTNIESNRSVTKRECVRAAGSLFDPLGLVAPTPIRAKIFIQKLWKEHLEWDEPLSKELTDEWQEIKNDLQDVAAAATVPRRYFDTMDTNARYELHVFCDASSSAYGAVVYLRNIKDNKATIVMSKAKVAPVKTLTIPRLELMAALVGSRLLKFVHNGLKDTVNIQKCILWTDSQIVLHWLKSDKKLPCFVQNRITEIKACDVILDFKYCPTDSNPADLISRGVSSSTLAESSLWWNGPDWLQTGHWPICDKFDTRTLVNITTAEELLDRQNTISANVATCQPTIQQGVASVIDINRFSSLLKLLRVTALVQRFIENLKTRTAENRILTKELTGKEIDRAEHRWIKDIQRQYYGKQIDELTTKAKTLGPLIRQLRLFVDDDGILRVGGRLHNAPIRYEAKFPMLIPRESPLAKLVIHDSHEKVHHSGLQSTITDIRQRFWITQIRTSVKSVLRRCVICKLISGKPFRMPIPAPLQKDRLLGESPVFTVCGVDFTGAMYYKDEHSNSERKAYICLFTCAVTRAIHLELVTDLSTSTFLRAFRRFVARRSLPRKMISDNGSTYLSAADEIKNIFDSPHVKNYLANRRVDWQFIPKRAPWFGGFWERLIGLTKTSLKKVLGRAFVTHDELVTVLTEIEAGLNDRPLTYVTDDMDTIPLTPSHFLTGHRLTTVPYDIDTDEITDPTFNAPTLRDRYNRIGRIMSHFWKRWNTEYLSALRENDRISGKGITDNEIKVGDVVQIQGENSNVARSKWQLGVVQNVYQGRDGLIRSVDMKTKAGKLNRPIAKLYPLEVHSNIFDDNKQTTTPLDTSDNDQQPKTRPKRQAAVKAKDNIKNWANKLLSD